jgi:hypothetical protein
VNWFRRCAFGSHLGEWLALALVILLTFALCVALLRLVFWLLKRERDTDESESEYWRIPGDKTGPYLPRVSGTSRLARVYRTNHPVTLFAKEGVGGRVAVSSTQMDMTPANQHQTIESPAMRSDSLAGDFIIAKCLQNEIDYGLISGTCTSSASIARPSRQSS